ncbi:SseB family protein [Streptomyces sp. NBC_00285]|uniref:SseB family protein n=1 Tax=Streptomyces sp. NBC_00285 TaxID=2975700 RepID=UPI002E2C167A|nr:SseB family protein [Streptomyces sp. NBC_00285]
MTVDVADGRADGLGEGQRATLVAEIHDLYDGKGDGDRLLAAFRAAALYVPLAEDEAMCSGESDGVRWLYAFTSTTELERFARARLGSGTDPGWESGRIRYWTVFGSRLLDVAVPAAVAEARAPAGVAVDVGGVRTLLLPPLSGIVPDPVAVDLIDRTSESRDRSAEEA